jgi:hypothetical protein
MRWLEANRLMVIGEYHQAFCRRFRQTDVTAANLHGLRKRKGWKIGPELARGRMLGRHTKYSAAEVAWLRDNHAMKIADWHRGFCERFNRTDVTKSALNSFRKKHKWKTGRDGRFNKGAVPWSRGKKIGNNPGSARTQFKKGDKPHNAKPFGYEHVRTDGYVEISVAQTNPYTGSSRWMIRKHVWLWEQQHGPVPEGMALKCKGDRRNADPSNWELVPVGLLPRLNAKSGRNYDKAPSELKPTIMAVAKLEHRLAQKTRAKP